MLIRAAHAKLSDIEVKINETKKICDLILSDPETSDYSLLDQAVDSLLAESAPLVAECERELEEFNNKYPAALSDCLNVLKDADAPALMRNKLEEARRAHADSKETIEKKEVTEEEIKDALDKMKEWNVKRIMEEACSFAYKESALTGGIDRDQLAIRVERSALKMLKSAKSEELIQLRQIYDRRSDLQVFYMSLLKYKSYRKLGKDMPFSVLFPLEMSFRCYKKSCAIFFNYVKSFKSEDEKKGVEVDRLREIMNLESKSNKILLLKSPKKSKFCFDVSKKSLSIEGIKYLGESDDPENKIIEFVKTKMKQKLDENQVNSLVENILSYYVQDIIKFPCIVLNSFSEGKLHTADNSQANIYVENNEVYIKVLHSDISVIDEYGVKKDANLSVEALFKLGNEGFELVEMVEQLKQVAKPSPQLRAEEQKIVAQPVPAAREEKQQQKGWFSSLSTTKKVMLGIGAALVVGGIAVATAGVGGVALVAAGAALGVGAMTAFGTSISDSRFGNWYKNLSRPKKVVFCLAAGVALLGLGVLTGGLAYAGIAHVTLGAAITAGAVTKVAAIGATGTIAAKTGAGALAVAAGAKITHKAAKPSSTAIIAQRAGVRPSVSSQTQSTVEKSSSQENKNNNSTASDISKTEELSDELSEAPTLRRRIS